MAKQPKETTSQPRYAVKAEYLGKDVWTILPEYPRPDGAKFILDENISQTDLAFLANVVKHEAVEEIS